MWVSFLCGLAQKALKHRRVKHYGFEFRYDNNNVDKDKPLSAGELLIIKKKHLHYLLLTIKEVLHKCSAKSHYILFNSSLGTVCNHPDT